MYLRKTNHPDRCVSTRRLGRVPDMEATDTNNPNLNYGLVVDCGSSGSRVFVYTWPRHNGNPHELLDIKQMRDKHRKPVVMKIKPGNFFLSVCVFPGNWSHNLCDANAMLYHWATGTIVYDRRTFWRQCLNVINTTWGYIYFLTCKNFGREFRTLCAKTFSVNFVSYFLFRLCLVDCNLVCIIFSQLVLF